MIHLFSPAPALDLEAVVRPPVSGKIGALGQWSFSPGGKAVNLARFLRAWKMSGRLTLGCGGGTDPSHVLYAALLRREGLRASYVDPLAPIRLNLVTHQPEHSSKYNHSGFPLSAKSLAVYERATLARLKRGDTWVLAGRVPSGAVVARVPVWAKRLEARGVRCVVDTSGLPLKALLKVSPSFLKVNLHEIGDALDRRIGSLEDFLVLLPSLQSRGLRHGAVTDGDRGALLWDGAEIALARPPKVRASSGVVVGAGDAFLAGYLKAWRDRASLTDRARWAVASGACVARDGIDGFDPRVVVRLARGVTFG